MAFIKVHLGTQNLWFDEEEFLTTGKAPLAYPEHCEDGELIFGSVFQDSYAHAYRDGIYRYHQKIGMVEDLKEGWI